YLDLFFVAVGIFGVTYFLSNMPQFEDTLTIESYPVVIKVLIVTILMPLVTVYTVVLYAYFAKILFGWQWPEGLIGQLVVWYGLISIFILFMIQDLGENSPWVKNFKKYFPIAFLVPLTMMFIAIGIRIYHNGFTLPRYYVVLVGVWLLIMAGYYLIYQRSKTTFAIVSAIILLTISIFGPLNGTNVSILSQNNRLEALLKESNVLVNGVIVPNEELSDEEEAKINSIVYYLDTLEALDQVSYLPKEFTLSKMKDVFGFQYDYSFNPDNEPNYFSYYQNGLNSITDVAPYDFVIRFAAYEDSESTITKDDLKFVASLENDKIELYWRDKIIAIQSIEDIARALYTRLGTNSQGQNADMTYQFENDQAIVLLDLTNLYGTMEEDVFEVTSIEGSAWVTLK
ncbi:MAG: DUF4153 domain-containing protein, partial [Vallitaleaceae bacterium]|nr:DUF4153 domain-containing protein [Vallitaleaceae bacterium]